MMVYFQFACFTQATSSFSTEKTVMQVGVTFKQNCTNNMIVYYSRIWNLLESRRSQSWIFPWFAEEERMRSKIMRLRPPLISAVILQEGRKFQLKMQIQTFHPHSFQQTSWSNRSIVIHNARLPFFPVVFYTTIMLSGYTVFQLKRSCVAAWS